MANKNMGLRYQFPPLIQQALRIPSLSPEEESALWDQYKFANSKEARKNAANRIISAHLKLCAGIAREYAQTEDELYELYGAAQLGMSTALNKYDPENKTGARFATYAAWWIKAEIYQHIERNRYNIRIGTSPFEKHLMGHYSKILDRLQKAHPQAHIDELHGMMAEEWMDKKDVPLEKRAQRKKVLIQYIQEFCAKRASTASVDAPVSNGEGSAAFIDFVASPDPDTAEIVEEHQEHTRRRALLLQALAVLNEREKHILIARKLSEPKSTLEELAVKYKISRERVRQIEAEAFRKLKREMLQLARGNVNRHAILADHPEPVTA